MSRLTSDEQDQRELARMHVIIDRARELHTHLGHALQAACDSDNYIDAAGWSRGQATTFTLAIIHLLERI